MSGRTQEVAACGLDTQSHLQLHCEFGSPVFSKNDKERTKEMNGTGNVAQLVEHLPSQRGLDLRHHLTLQPQPALRRQR